MGLAAIAAASIAAALWRMPEAPRVQATAAAIPAPAITPAAKPDTPSFDVVRVAPDGGAVLAGRAPPGADVVVRNGDAELGRAHTDSRGEWVLVPEKPVAPGTQQLTLAERNPDGTETAAPAPVILSTPNAAAPSTTRLAAVVPPTGPVRVLQGGSATPGHLGLGTLDYDEQGAIQFGGSAPPNAPVRVYVDNKPVGDARADASGAWTLRPQGEVATGLHHLRVDQLTSTGRVEARVQMPFQRSVVATGSLTPGRIVVQPGESLWRIARNAYGRGVQYTLIFAANRDQIRDPNRIWPGQVFATPGT